MAQSTIPPLVRGVVYVRILLEISALVRDLGLEEWNGGMEKWQGLVLGTSGLPQSTNFSMRR